MTAPTPAALDALADKIRTLKDNLAVSIDRKWLRDKIRDILAVTSRGHSRERFLEVETLVSLMRDHLDRAAPEVAASPPSTPDAAAYWQGVAERALSRQIDMAREHAEAVEAAVLAERAACLAAVQGERLEEDDPDNPYDVAYNRAIAHCAEAIEPRSASPKPGSGE